jgi:hypothetical protein
MTSIRACVLMGAAVLAACAGSGANKLGRSMGTWDATGMGDMQPVESFEGTIVKVYDDQGIRWILVRGDNGAEQVIDASGDIEVEAEEAGQVVPGDPFAVKYRVHLPMTGDHLLWAARDGGGHIRGNLLRQLDGRWLAHRMRVVLTPAQVAEAHELARQEAAAASAARERDALRREAEAKARIAAWRALKVKPPLPAEADRLRVLGEKALAENRYDEARTHYKKALDIEPLWPAGQRTMAELEADALAYRSAMRYMQTYLDLLPDAPDGLAARNKLRIWEQEDLKRKQR